MHTLQLIMRFAFIGVLGMLLSCASDPKVERIENDQVTDLSGNWNDTDSRLVAEEMTKDLLSQDWYARQQGSSNTVPSIIVGLVRNKSHDHIDAFTFTKDIERYLINSGMVELVASSDQREEIRGERAQQDLYSSAETRKAIGEELGADLILQGSISSILDANSKQQARFYQVDLELIEIESTRKVWIGQKKIKKLIGKDQVRL